MSNFQLTKEDIVKAYVLGDEEIISVIHQALSFMVMSITNLQMVIDTNLIFVHGELFDQAEIIDTLEKYINANKTVIPTIPNPIINIYHYYDTNGARGACAMAMKKDLIDYMVDLITKTDPISPCIVVQDFSPDFEVGAEVKDKVGDFSFKYI